MMKKILFQIFVGVVFVSLLTQPTGFCEDLSSAASSESEMVKVDGDQITIQQDLSDEAKKENEKSLAKRMKKAEKVSKQEAKMAKQIRKDKRIKEKAEAKQAAKLERKKKEWEWKQNR